jgi:4-amino-4-deoxy-L-arabinose transferase-like glycosyltransferase
MTTASLHSRLLVRGTSRRLRDLAAIGSLALVLRAAWVLAYGRVEPGPNDTIFYMIASDSLAHGRGYTTLFGQPTAHWPPGFPFLVSLVYRLFGSHPGLGLALNVALGSATALLIYLVAERMFGRRGGLVAGVGFAILPGPLFFTGLFLSETTFIFILVGFLALALRLPDRRWTPLVLGVALGLAALSRGEGVLMAVIPLAMWWGHLSRPAWLRRAAVLLVAMALTVLPWTIRNAIVMKAFIPVSTNASTTLWSGHNPAANGGPTYAPPSLLARVPHNLHSPAGEVAEARLLRREAVRWASHHPIDDLALIPRKLLALNQPVSRVFGTWFNARGDRQVGATSRRVFGAVGNTVSYLLLLATLASLVLVGVRRLWRIHPGMQGVLAYLALCLFAYGFVYYGQYRYRMPMEPLMLLVATPLVLRLWSRRTRRGLSAGARRAPPPRRAGAAGSARRA